TYGGGVLLFSNNPIGGQSSWQTVFTDSDNDPLSVTCASMRMCVMTDAGVNFNLVSSRTPTVAGTWTSVPLARTGPGYQGWGLSCSHSEDCVAVFGSSADMVFSSDDPTSGEGAWTQSGPTNPDGGVSCLPTFCVVSAGAGFAYTAHVGASDQQWNDVAPEVDGVDALYDVTCASRSFCAVADSSGNIVTSSAPIDRSVPWTVTTTDAHPGGLHWVSCPSDNLCVAGDDFGQQLYSTDPAGSGSWSSSSGDSAGYSVLECPYSDLCVGSDQESRPVFTTSPSSGQPWSISPVYTGTWPNDAVACASPQDCALASGSGYVDASFDGLDSMWNAVQIAPGQWLSGISCPSTNLCLAVDQGGQVWDSTDPFSASPQWTLASTPDAHGLEAISCPDSSLCVAVDDVGDALVTTDPTGPASAWSTQDIDGSYPLTAIWCGIDASMCVASDKGGRIVVGQITQKHV
ncbi:MAG: hypothetical protein ACREP9_03560, partial [Candidatus Dormibacteraceae bacterium]